MPSLLPFRPVSALHRLPPRSRACPLSLRHVLAAPGLPRGPVPFVVAPFPFVARGALLAARESGAAVGLLVPRGVHLPSWLEAVAAAADGLAPGHPFVVAAEVAVASATEADVEEAGLAAARLVEHGATHLAVDPAALGPRDRAPVAADVAALASDREIGIELLLSADEIAAPERAAAQCLAFRSRGVALDLAGARFVRPRDEAGVRAQARAIALLARAVNAPVFRHGPSSPELLRALAGAPLGAADDGGAALAAGWRTLSPEERAALEAGGGRGDGGLAAATAERLEALAWSEATAFLEALGAQGSARALAGAFQEA